MLEPYAELLERLRRDRGAWTELAYRPVRDAEGWPEDPGYRARLGVTACLQYDLRPEDEDLVRYLFSEEVQARSAGGLGGEGDVLHPAAYLLAGFRREA